MGGIKNKLSKLSNKVKTLFNKATNLPPLLGEADENRRFSIGGVNKQNKSVGLTNESNPQSSCGRQLPLRKGALIPPFRKRRQMKSDRISIGGFDRLVRITKYTCTACLALAILSTLVLNIVRSYSSFKVNSNAEPVAVNGTPALANSSPCNPSTNAPSCISLSITSSTGGNGPNLSLSIPQGGGIATGGHTVRVNVGINVQGYNIAVSSDTASLVNNIGEHRSVIESVSAQMGKWSGGSGRWTGVQLGNLQWGMAIPDRDASYTDDSGGIWQFYPYQYSGRYDTTDQTQLAKSTWTAVPIGDEQGVIFEQSNAQPATIDIYYGARVNSPSTMLAGNYTADVVYTVVAELMPEPEVDSATPNVYKIDSIKKLQQVGGDLYVLMSSGVIYSYDSYSRPTNFFEFGDRIIDFASADPNSFSLMVFTTDGNQVYSFGENDYGQLGNGATVDVDKSSPVNITNNFGTTVEKVFTGDNPYYVALTEDGHVYTWGCGGYGILGTGNSDNQSAPIDITSNFPVVNGRIVDIVLSGSTRYGTSFALTNTGHVYGWGGGRDGALGTGSDYDEYYPVDITDNFNLANNETVIQIAVGGYNGYGATDWH